MGYLPSLNQVRGANNKTDNQVYLSVSKPLSTENQNASISYFASYSDSNKRYANNVNYSRHVDSNTNYNLTASTQDGLSEGMVSTDASQCGCRPSPSDGVIIGFHDVAKYDHEWLGHRDTARYFLRTV
ncbi:hypothetical protein [Providencia hangzhouensis]|uniref:hypothetical protein n=1 Tax=Providencia hangzhouensis TaxID=3031799 RepID=UPI0034DD6550